MLPGVAVSARPGKWLPMFDFSNGWFCFHHEDVDVPTQAIEVCNGMIVELDHDLLSALWLRPEMVP
jgi:hypothetical protein